MILAPVVVNRKGEHVDLFEQMQAQGFIRFRVKSGTGPATVVDVDELPALKKNEKHTIDVVVDRVRINPDIKQRLAESFETALRIAEGRALTVNMDTGEEQVFSNQFACPICGYSLHELEPRLFSFNNPMGACPECDGLGHIEFFDPKRLSCFPVCRWRPAPSKAGTGEIRFISRCFRIWRTITISMSIRLTKNCRKTSGTLSFTVPEKWKKYRSPT